MVLIQFTQNGSSLTSAIQIPASLPRAQIEALLNTLNNSSTPYQFTLPNSQILSHSIEQDYPDFDEESLIPVECTPQSIWKVRPPTRCSSTLRGHSAPILSLSFSPTGELLATGSADHTTRLWDLASETPFCTLSGHTGWVLVTEWSPLGTILATGSHDASVRVWSAPWKTSLLLKGHTKWITSLAWQPIHLSSSSNLLLASGSKDATIKIWPTTGGTKTALLTLSGHTAAVNSVRWSSENIIYSASSDRTIRSWSTSNGQCLKVWKDHAHWVNTLSLSTDFLLRTGGYDWEKDATSSRSEQSYESLKAIASTRISSIPESSEVLVSGSDDHTLFLFPHNSAAQQKPTRMTGHTAPISHTLFSPTPNASQAIASASFDSTIRLWSAGTSGSPPGKFLKCFRGHVGPVYRLAWSNDARLLVSASKDHTVKVWDIATGKMVSDLVGHEDEVYCVDFVGDKIASGGRDGAVKIWKN